MDKILLVFKNELWRVVARRSFFLTLFLVPLVTFIVATVISSSQERDENNPVSQVLAGPEQPQVEGFVDLDGVLQVLPEDVQDRLVRFESEAEAQQALEGGEITAYYLIQPGYLENGEVIYIRPDFNPISGFSEADALQRALAYNLVDGDVKLLDRYDNPLGATVAEYRVDPQARDPENALTFFLPYGVTMVFYIVIFSSASLMLNSITDEKQNRVIEILMTSITPLQMLAGKIVALGLVGLLQTVVWAGMGLVFLRVSGQALNLPPEFQLPVSILAWGVLFFILGYAVFASLMAGIGALVPNLKEASQATLIVVIPLVIPLMMISALSQDPNGPLSVGLSLFPLTAPVTMMTRLAASRTIPIWQPLLAAGLLVVTAYLILRAVAGMFRAQNLLSGQQFSLKLFFLALLGRA